MKSLLKNQTNFIKGDLVRNLTLRALDNVKEAFYHNGASSTGKHHPDYGAGEGGLLRHTKAVVYFAAIFCKYLQISQYEKDCLIAAGILHDTCKLGIDWEANYTLHEHPLLVYKLLDVSQMNEVEARAWKDINNLIATHMGQWVTSNYSQLRLPKITLKSQAVLHWSDYLASRKAINVNHFGFTSLVPAMPAYSGKNSEIFKDEIGFIKDKVIAKMVKKALDKEIYNDLTSFSCDGRVPSHYRQAGGVISKMKTSLLVANMLLELETTFVDEHDKDIIYATLFFKELNESFTANELNGEEVIYWTEILGFLMNEDPTWERMIVDACEYIANDPTLAINIVKEDTKEWKPASEKQVCRLRLLLEEIQKREDYDGRYDRIKPENLSVGMAGKYISELKAIVG